MKKNTVLLFTIFFLSIGVFAQVWKNQLPSNKEEFSFYDYKKAFYDYWKPYNVEQGYYMKDGKKIKAPGWKQFKRWEWDMEGQINPKTGEFPKKSANQVYSEWKREKEIQPKTKDNNVLAIPENDNWINFGPNNSSGGYSGIGRINCVAFHPTDNNTYWVGAPAGGLWKTTDNGNSWTCLTDNNEALGVSGIIIPSDYTSSNTIYIATGDRDKFGWRGVNSTGVLKSTDGGTTWNATGLNFNFSSNYRVYSLVIHPTNNQILIASTNGGVYKTINEGVSWTKISTNTRMMDLEYNPNNPSTIYAGTKDGDIYKSTNNGINWTEKYSSLDERVEIAVSPANPNILYAIVGKSDGGLKRILKSTDSGENFTEIHGSTPNLMAWSSDGSDSGGQQWYDISIAVSPIDANKVIIGGINAHRSTNGGSSWSCANCWIGSLTYNKGYHPVVHADKHNHRYRSNGDLFECNDGGVYLSTNDGASWTDKSNGLVISQMYKLSVSQNSSDEVITGLQDNGTKLLNNGNWSDVRGGDGMECLIDYTNDNIQYGSIQYGKIKRTTNHWVGSETSIEPSGASEGSWITPYIISPVDHNTLYAGYEDVWKTTNKGDSWTKISTMSTSYKLKSMAISSDASVLVVSDYYNIWKTTNNGNSWTDITGTLPVSSCDIREIAIKHNDYNTIWVAMSGYDSDNVYQSTNGGSTWTNISAGLPQIPAYTIVQNKQSTSETHLYLGTELGVYFKSGTDNWEEFNTGLPNVKIGEIEIYYDNINSTNTKLRAATYGRGLWESSIEIPVVSLALINTLPVNTITKTSATSGGNVVSEGISSIIERGIVYATTPNPILTNNKIIDENVGIGNFISNIIGLTASTKYFVRAYATNSNGTSYGDEVSFTTLCDVITSYPYLQNFDSWTKNVPSTSCTNDGDVNLEVCWENLSDDDIDWNIFSENTSSMGTGPSTDHSTGTTGNYLYVESSSCYYKTGYIRTPQFDLTSLSNPTVKFWYHMYGDDMGTLSLQISTDGGISYLVTLWSKSGDQGNSWKEVVLNLSDYTEQIINFRFIGLIGNNYESDMAIDDFSIKGEVAIKPIATIFTTAGCSTGSVSVNSDKSGVQTFYLHDNNGNLISEWTGDATTHEFTGLSDATYKGKVKKDSEMSDLSAGMILTNFTNPTVPTTVSATKTTICNGESSTLSYIGGSGDNFKWYSNSCGGTLAGTENSLSVSPTSTTTYYGRWENECGNSSCKSLTITISQPATASTSVSATKTTICNGESSTLSYIGGSGDNFKWYSNSCGGTLAGTENSLSVSPTSTTTYYGRWENECGNSTCKSLTITISQPATAATSVFATKTTICNGESTTLSYNGGNGDYFQWYDNEGNFAGTGNSLSVLPSITTTYFGKWISACENFNLKKVDITVDSAIQITTQPASITEKEGNNVEFIVVANGGNLEYQWRKNNINIETNANDKKYVLFNIIKTSEGDYDCIITNNCMSMISDKAKLTITPSSIENIKEKGIEIFPNPTNGIVNIKIDKAMISKIKNISIFNSAGESVFSTKEINSKQIIDLSELSSGLYMLNINKEGKIISTKIILN